MLQPSKLASALESIKTPPPCEPRERELKLHWGDGGNVKEGSKCERSHSTAHRQGTVRTSSGAMEEMSRKVQSASTHIFGLVVVDVTIDKVCGASDESPSSLP